MFKKTATYKQRQLRMTTEWDVRLDVSNELPVEEIIDNAKKLKDDVLYVLVSGVERPDKLEDGVVTKKFGASDGEHVHVCLVLLEPKVRQDVLKMLRGPRKRGDEYAAPRNAKFAYAGWVIHHAKPTWKIPGEPPIRYEHGTLPMDPLTIEWSIKINAMLKKFGYDLMRRRFQAYTNLLTKHKTMEKIEGLLMSMQDEDVSE